MSKTKADKLYTNFSKGLITESSPLTFPEGASLDELNCDMDFEENRIRRYGIDNNGTFSKIDLLGYSADPNIYSYVWKSVADNDQLDFLVIAIEGILHFYECTGESTFTKKSFTVDVNLKRISSASYSDITTNRCTFTHGKGTLFVVHPFAEPFRITYNAAGDTISADNIVIKMRDFVGVDDGLAVDEEPATLSNTHNYNLRNQGWINPEATGTGTTITSWSQFGNSYTFLYPTTTGPIAEYFTAKSRYPGNNKVWWTGKDAEGDFDPNLLAKTFFGNTRAARGHFVLNAFNKDRSAVSGVAGLTAEVATTRPEAITFTSGRVFFGHEATLYMSPVLTEVAKAGDCFQEADPTAEDISDLIATDGGVIEIPDADKIVALRPLSGGVVVFATNGVWYVASGSQGFTALEYSLSQVSSVGTNSPEAIVVGDTTIFWWSKVGIQAMQQSVGQFGPVSGQFDKSNITEDTIQSFYNSIPTAYIPNVRGVFDPAQNRVIWLYRVDGGKKKRLLIFDIKRKAFIPWEVDNGGSTIASMFMSPNFSANTYQPSFVEFLTKDVVKTIIGATTFETSKLGLSNFVDKNYRDFNSMFSNPTAYPPTAYASYVETGYEVMQDGLRKKQTPFVGVFFKRTEELLDVDGGSATLVYPSSCKMQVKWDWAINSRTKKWSTEVQAYRPKSAPFFTSTTSNRTDYDLVYSRNKVRGSGRSVQFKFFEDRIGYGFTLVGWHVFFEGKSSP